METAVSAQKLQTSSRRPIIAIFAILKMECTLLRTLVFALLALE